MSFSSVSRGVGCFEVDVVGVLTQGVFEGRPPFSMSFWDNNPGRLPFAEEGLGRRKVRARWRNRAPISAAVLEDSLTPGKCRCRPTPFSLQMAPNVGPALMTFEGRGGE
jgi:hypothetical protein